MDIQKQREAFEKLPLAELAIKCGYVYYNKETNSYWPNDDDCPASAPESMNFAWQAWQQAQKVAVPETHVLIEKSKLESFYQDDDDPENFCSKIEDIDVLGENLDVGNIMVINKITSAYVSTEKLYGVLVGCKEVAPYFKKTTLKVFSNYDDAYKAVIEAQEQN